jgi:membrane protein insertase Oxa1/YidC/SpoIIIJ
MLGGGITSFNVLPILMTVAMYLQQKLTPSTATGPQADQQKKMMVFMNLFLLLVLYNAPAGLCLYIFTSSLLGFVEQRYLKKMYMEHTEGGPAQPAPKEPTPPKKSPYIAGKPRSLAERIRQRIAAGGPRKDEGEADRGRRGKR